MTLADAYKQNQDLAARLKAEKQATCKHPNVVKLPGGDYECPDCERREKPHGMARVWQLFDHIFG